GLTSIHPLGQVPLNPLERILWPHHRREPVKHLFHVRGPVPVLLQHIRPGSGLERHTKHHLDRRRHGLGDKVVPQPHTRPCTQRRGLTRCGICCDSTRAKDRFLCLGEVLLKRLYQSLVQRVVCLALGSARVENRHSLPQNRGTPRPGQGPCQVFTPV